MGVNDDTEPFCLHFKILTVHDTEISVKLMLPQKRSDSNQAM
jgi:hypothetical protein